MEDPLREWLSKLPPIPKEELARRERAALRLRARYISIPYYAARDQREGMDYWRNLQGSAVLADE